MRAEEVPLLSDAAVLRILYEELLDRSPDAAEIETGLAYMATGQSGWYLVHSICNSSERQAALTIRQDRNSAQTLGVVHVPKCAGTSLVAQVAHLPGLYCGPYYYASVDRAGRLRPGASGTQSELAPLVALLEIVRRSRVVIGHYRTWTLIELGVSRVIATVREPRSRLLSLYAYWKTLPEHELAHLGEWGSKVERARELTFGEFIESEEYSRELRGALCAQMVLPTGATNLDDFRVHELWREVKPAIERAYWPFELPSLVSRVRAATSPEESVPEFAAAEYERKRVTPRLTAPQVLTRPQVAALNDLVAPDRELLSLLARSKKISPRSTGELDEEWARTAARHSITLPSKRSKGGAAPSRHPVKPMSPR